MSETCAVCKKGKGPEICEVCGFTDGGSINREWLNKEDAEHWLETVVKPYRMRWEAKQKEAELLAQIGEAKKREDDLLAQIDALRTKPPTPPAPVADTMLARMRELEAKAQSRISTAPLAAKKKRSFLSRFVRVAVIAGLLCVTVLTLIVVGVPRLFPGRYIFNVGNAYYEKGDYVRAITKYTEAIRLDPNSAVVYNNRGDAYYNKGDYDRAITDYTEAIRLDPTYTIAYNNRVDAYKKKGDGRATADYAEAKRLNPKYNSTPAVTGVATQPPISKTPTTQGPVTQSTPAQPQPAPTSPSTQARSIGTFTDSRDGKKYKTVKIGTQTWIAENLNYNASGSTCYDNNPSNCDKYGRLYNWETARKACPVGWHLPSDAEWTTLTDYVGGKSTEGRKLKSTSGWNDYDGRSSGNGTDEYGFAALPGGNGNSDGDFHAAGTSGYWQSATESNADNASNLNMHYFSENAFMFNYSLKNSKYSVRCVQD